MILKRRNKSVKKEKTSSDMKRKKVKSKKKMNQMKGKRQERMWLMEKGMILEEKRRK